MAVLTGKKRRVGARQKKGDEEHHTLTELDGEHARASPDSSGEGDDQDSDWEERQDDERDERMQADFARGGKKKRRIMARIDTDSPWPCENCSRRFKSVSEAEHRIFATAREPAADSKLSCSTMP